MCKKIISIILSVAISLNFLVACGKKEEVVEDVSTEETEITELTEGALKASVSNSIILEDADIRLPDGYKYAVQKSEDSEDEDSELTSYFIWNPNIRRQHDDDVKSALENSDAVSFYNRIDKSTLSITQNAYGYYEVYAEANKGLISFSDEPEVLINYTVDLDGNLENYVGLTYIKDVVLQYIDEFTPKDETEDASASSSAEIADNTDNTTSDTSAEISFEDDPILNVDKETLFAQVENSYSEYLLENGVVTGTATETNDYILPYNNDVSMYVYAGVDKASPDTFENIQDSYVQTSMMSYLNSTLGANVSLRNTVWDSNPVPSNTKISDASKRKSLNGDWWVMSFTSNSGNYDSTTYGTMLYPKTYYGFFLLQKDNDGACRKWYGFIFTNDSYGSIFYYDEYNSLISEIKSQFGIEQFYTLYDDKTSVFYNADEDYSKGKTYKQLITLFSSTFKYYIMKNGKLNFEILLPDENYYAFSMNDNIADTFHFDSIELLNQTLTYPFTVEDLSTFNQNASFNGLTDNDLFYFNSIPYEYNFNLNSSNADISLTASDTADDLFSSTIYLSVDDNSTIKGINIDKSANADAINLVLPENIKIGMTKKQIVDKFGEEGYCDNGFMVYKNDSGILVLQFDNATTTQTTTQNTKTTTQTTTDVQTSQATDPMDILDGDSSGDGSTSTQTEHDHTIPDTSKVLQIYIFWEY